MPNATPGPAFETEAFGPFLVVRTKEPVGTPRSFLEATLAVQELGLVLGVGDAGLNAATVEKALEELG